MKGLRRLAASANFRDCIPISDLCDLKNPENLCDLTPQADGPLVLLTVWSAIPNSSAKTYTSSRMSCSRNSAQLQILSRLDRREGCLIAASQLGKASSGYSDLGLLSALGHWSPRMRGSREPPKRSRLRSFKRTSCGQVEASTSACA